MFSYKTNLTFLVTMEIEINENILGVAIKIKEINENDVLLILYGFLCWIIFRAIHTSCAIIIC